MQELSETTQTQSGSLTPIDGVEGVLIIPKDKSVSQDSPRLLIVQTGFLGDVLLTTPVISGLRTLYPKAQIYFLTTPVAKPLLECLADLEGVITFDKRGRERGWSGLWVKARELKAMKFDAVFGVHKSWRTSVLLWLSGIPQRYGFKEAHGSFFYTKTTARFDLPHEALRNQAILRTVGLEPTRANTSLSVAWSKDQAEEAERILARLATAKLVGIAPGSAWATKRWSVEGFVAVAEFLVGQGYKVVILGTAQDEALARVIKKGLGEDVLDLTGQTKLSVSAAIISRLSLLICNDSLPLHLASALKIPVVALFCATVPEFGFGPWQTESRVLGVRSLSCRPCGRHGGNKCPTGTEACISGISADAVCRAAIEILASQTKVVPGESR